MDRHKNKFPLIAGALYLMNAVFSVVFAWTHDSHLYDLGISFSSYVGMYRFTSTLYFVSAVVIIALISVYTVRTKMPLVKKTVYFLVFLCILGAAFFPFNRFSENPTPITIDLHNDFAIALMLMTTASFVLTLILSKHKGQKIAAACSIAYAATFIVLYFGDSRLLSDTFFIWENLFILLLLLAVHMEQYGENTD